MFNTTALMYAASKGNKEIVELLLSSGADVNATDGGGNTVLTAAKESQNSEIIMLIESNR
ncbi:ankyrin repeat domain-containing protein [Rufibacter sp. XAAS-G3-1]|uniref:ankyrin repeat domain-containing protein n=1 Tax=Rufibacter sp. XAAS-G3-1 TaxID=2729134 RepID=UPI0015E636F9